MYVAASTGSWVGGEATDEKTAVAREGRLPRGCSDCPQRGCGREIHDRVGGDPQRPVLPETNRGQAAVADGVADRPGRYPQEPRGLGRV